MRATRCRTSNSYHSFSRKVHKVSYHKDVRLSSKSYQSSVRRYCTETPTATEHTQPEKADWISGVGTKPLMVVNVHPHNVVRVPLNKYLPAKEVDPSEKISLIPPEGFQESHIIDPRRTANQIFVARGRSIHSNFWSKHTYGFQNLKEFLEMRAAKFYYDHPRGKITTVTSYPESAVAHLKGKVPFSIRVYETPFYMWGHSLAELAVPSVIVETPEGVWENSYLGLVNTKNFYNTNIHHTQITQLLKCIKVNEPKAEGEQAKEEEQQQNAEKDAASSEVESTELVIKEPDEDINLTEDEALQLILSEFGPQGEVRRRVEPEETHERAESSEDAQKLEEPQQQQQGEGLKEEPKQVEELKEAQQPEGQVQEELKEGEELKEAQLEVQKQEEPKQEEGLKEEAKEEQEAAQEEQKEEEGQKEEIEEEGQHREEYKDCGDVDQDEFEVVECPESETKVVSEEAVEGEGVEGAKLEAEPIKDENVDGEKVAAEDTQTKEEEEESSTKSENQ